MKVVELIRLLNQFDDNEEVAIYVESSDFAYDIKTVQIYDDGEAREVNIHIN